MSLCLWGEGRPGKILGRGRKGNRGVEKTVLAAWLSWL